MKTPAFKITCKTNTEAIILANCLDEIGYTSDERNGNILFLSIEALKLDNVIFCGNLNTADIENGICECIEETSEIYEFDFCPSIETVTHDFNEL